jgi:hypothetical protein
MDKMWRIILKVTVRNLHIYEFNNITLLYLYDESSILKYLNIF